MVISTALGAAALIAAVAGLIAGDVLPALFATATIALWLVATIRHLFMVSPNAVNGRDMHEVIHPEKSVPRCR